MTAIEWWTKEHKYSGKKSYNNRKQLYEYNGRIIDILELARLADLPFYEVQKLANQCGKTPKQIVEWKETTGRK